MNKGITMSRYSDDIQAAAGLIATHGSAWEAIDPESVARMKAQNRFRTGLDIAKYTAKIMREDMARYDADPSQYTQSLGCWHGFIGQQKLIAIKKHFGDTNKRYLYLSGWMIAALRSEFGPLPDQSMHEKTSVPGLIEELFLATIDESVNNLAGALDYSTHITYKNYPGILYRIKYNQGKAVVKSKAYVIGDEFYVLQVFSTIDNSINDTMDQYLDSFRIETL